MKAPVLWFLLIFLSFTLLAEASSSESEPMEEIFSEEWTPPLEEVETLNETWKAELEAAEAAFLEPYESSK